MTNQQPAQIAPVVAYQYEASISSATAKQEGIFYTPFVLVTRLVKEALSLISNSRPSVLDPSCGGGLFLVATFRYLAAQATDQNLEDILKDSIFGVDRDPKAVEVTRAALKNEYLELNKNLALSPAIDEILQKNIVVSDSLMLPIVSTNENLSWQSCFPEVFARKGFSVVIGNPPYGLSRGGKLSAQELKAIRHRFAKQLSGKPNKFIAFMALGAELLSPNGLMTFVVPNSWLGIKDGFKIRQYLLSSGAFQYIDTYKTDVFDPAVEVISFHWKKSCAKDAITIRHYQSGESDTTNSECAVPASTILSDGEQRIPLNWNKESDSVLNKIDLGAVALSKMSDIFTPRIAIQAYALGKGQPAQTADCVKNHLFHSPNKLNDTYYKYLNGGDIGRYNINWSGEYLSYGPWLAEQQSIDRFTGPRIVVREILAKGKYWLQASLITEAALYNKSVLHINLANNADQKYLHALLAILNSKLASFYIQARGRKSQRSKFPKLVIADLKEFPFPKSDITALAQLGLKASTSPTTTTLNEEIDQLVFSAYNLDNSDIKIINDQLI